MASLKWDKLIVALDFEEKNDIEKVVKVLLPKKVKFKVGSIAFTKFGPDLVSRLIKKDAKVFLDLKLYDIPNTMKGAAGVITGLGCWAFTVHAKAGYQALKAVKEEVEARAKKNKTTKPLILGVTELTSSRVSLSQVLNLTKVAHQAEIDGVIASAREAYAIKKEFGKALLVVTPGIRNPKDEVDDQKRVMSAKAAFEAGADYIVVGRPIVSKLDYLTAAREILSNE